MLSYCATGDEKIATTIFINDSVNWVKAFVVQRPTTGVAGIAGEPAITTANLIMQSILGAPFKWEWNRTQAASAFTTIPNTSDYKVSLPTFGYLEKAVLVDPTPAPGQPSNWELQLYKVIAKDGTPNRSEFIATQLDDNAGNITFRLFPPPNKVYNVDLTFQNAPLTIPQGANLSTTLWAPIPDKMSYLYQRGFLAQLQGMYNSQLYVTGMTLFFRQLVAASEGLTEAEKAIFLEESLRLVQTQAASLQTIQQGKAARS